MKVMINNRFGQTLTKKEEEKLIEMYQHLDRDGKNGIAVYEGQAAAADFGRFLDDMAEHFINKK